MSSRLQGHTNEPLGYGLLEQHLPGVHKALMASPYQHPQCWNLFLRSSPRAPQAQGEAVPALVSPSVPSALVPTAHQARMSLANRISQPGGIRS